jgi:hypothetical protein
MDIATFAAALGIIASVVTTTMVVVGKLTRVEVMLAELRASMAHYDRRLADLERKINERQS